MYKALIIGANIYKDHGIPPLPNTLNDAQSIFNILNNPPSLFEPTEIQLFSGNQVRVNTIRAVVQDFFNNANSDDIIFFFWAGHGCLINNEGYLITFNTQTENIDNTALSMNELRLLINRCNAKVLFAWLDCCHSGAAARAVDLQGWMARGLEVNGSGKIIIAACKDTQFSYEHDTAKHGEFTFHLINGLTGNAADEEGNINALQLYSYIVKQIESSGKLQTPVLKCTLRGNVVLHVTGNRIIPSKNKLGLDAYNTLSRIKDSGNWCLMGDVSFQYSRIKENAAENIEVEVVNPSQHIEGYLNKLRDMLRETWWKKEELSFVFRNNAYKVSVVDIEALVLSEVTYKIVLKKENSTSSTMEMGVGIGTSTISADDIAMMRVRRILIGESRHPEFSRTEWQQIEMFVKGFDRGETIKEPPMPELLLKYRVFNNLDMWKCIRLELIKLLIYSNCVEQVHKLILDVEDNEIISIEFEGVRRQQYSNVPPVKIQLNEKIKR